MYEIVISLELNNSLGQCWLVKLENYAALVDKTLYPRSDFSGKDALLRFMTAQDLELEDIASFANLVSGQDAELDRYIAEFELFGAKPRHAVEYRDMHTALHMLAIYSDEAAADRAYNMLASENESEINSALSQATSVFEIDYRYVEQDTTYSGQWYYPDDDGAYIIDNPAHVVPDVYA